MGAAGELPLGLECPAALMDGLACGTVITIVDDDFGATGAKVTSTPRKAADRQDFITLFVLRRTARRGGSLANALVVP